MFTKYYQEKGVYFPKEKMVQLRCVQWGREDLIFTRYGRVGCEIIIRFYLQSLLYGFVFIILGCKIKQMVLFSLF